MDVSIRLTEKHYGELMSHLHSGDGKESVAFALCGRAKHKKNNILLINKIVLIPYQDCSIRKVDKVKWESKKLPKILDEAEKKGWGIIKFHSHPVGLSGFSEYDDISDKELFPSIYSWIDSSQPHASIIVLANGQMIGRVVSEDGEFSTLKSMWLIGSDIKQLALETEQNVSSPQYAKRITQTFGDKTFSILQSLKIGVVGCSGTGGPVIEQLVRNCVGKLVLVDPDYIDEGNLNRIPNSTICDVRNRVTKVNMHKRAIDSFGLGTQLAIYHSDLFKPDVVRALSTCDVIFGCMDTVDGRHLLNKLATYYLIPYFDIGVKLIAEGNGGINNACCQCHYLQPGKSSLLSRGVYTLKQLEAAGLYRTDHKAYEQQKKESYIDGVNVDKPAVVSINTLAASIAVNDLLARLHPYRRVNNSEIAVTRFSFMDMLMPIDPEFKDDVCKILQYKVGLGDTPLLLDTPELSEIREAA